MSYKTWRNSGGCLRKEWRNEDEKLHREDGPAYICYYPDGSIHWEEFYISGAHHRESGPAQIWYHPDGSIYCELFHVSGEFLGRNNKGFWALWGRLTEVERQAPELLKCLTRYL